MQQAETRQYEFSPLAEVQRWSELEGGLGLFESILVFENYPIDAPLRNRGGSVEVGQGRLTEATNYPLCAVVTPSPELSLQLKHDSRRFSGAAIKRMLGHFQNILAAFAADLEQPLPQISLLTEAERSLLLTEVSGPLDEYRPEQQQCLHNIFEQQVERTPDAHALVFEGQHMTYRQLNRRANQLAHYLREQGVGMEVLVGLCVERSIEMVVAVLGILKAGGAYVPLDPAYPRESLAFMLENAQLRVAVTRQRLAEQFGEHDVRLVCLDTDSGPIGLMSEDNPASQVMPDNTAYVIYTSGSTGKPKGVSVSHDNVWRLFEKTQPWFNFGEKDVWTLFHSYAFDFSVWELWGALLYGGKVVIVSYPMSRTPQGFYNLLATEQVTVLNQTPSAFYQLIDAEEAAQAVPQLALRLVIFGGEALDVRNLKPWFKRHGDQQPQLVNMYGITETTVHVTYRPLVASDLSAKAKSMIGSVIPD
jgi:amino acid adenylation domain-containing protein